MASEREEVFEVTVRTSSPVEDRIEREVRRHLELALGAANVTVVRKKTEEA